MLPIPSQIYEGPSPSPSPSHESKGLEFQTRMKLLEEVSLHVCETFHTHTTLIILLQTTSSGLPLSQIDERMKQLEEVSLCVKPQYFSIQNAFYRRLQVGCHSHR